MGKWKFKVGNIDVEYEGDLDAKAIQAIRALAEKPLASAAYESLYDPPHSKMEPQVLPSRDEIIKYLRSKLNFEHSLAEIQEHLYGKKINWEEKEYKVLAKRWRRAKRRLEEEEKGKFVGEWKQLPNWGRVKVFKFTKS